MKTVHFRRLTAILLSSLCTLLLISCAGKNNNPVISSNDGPPSENIDVSQIPNAIPRPTTPSHYGNPASYEVYGKRYYVMSSSNNYKQRGIASWYGSKFHGKRTSSGEPYNMHAMTAAHKTLPLPTYVKVTNLKNKRQVILKVNDRGPFHEGRIIDLSHTAAVKLGIKATGTGWVEVEAINTSLPPEVSDNKTSITTLYIQLGVFSNSDNAYQLTEHINLRLSSNHAHIIKKLKNGQVLYTVRIGPFNNIAEAEEQVLSLTEKGISAHHFIIEEY